MTEPSGNPIYSTAFEIESFCRAQGWRFCFIGGVAVQRWGEPRFTEDVDLTLLAGFGSELSYVDPLLGRYKARLPDARQFALRSRVVLLETAEGVPIDVGLAGMPFEERAVARASPFDIGNGRTITTCSAEDLIVFKAFAGRDLDWVDIERIVVRQGDRLDLGLIREELLPLLELKEEPEAAERFEAILRTARE